MNIIWSSHIVISFSFSYNLMEISPIYKCKWKGNKYLLKLPFDFLKSICFFCAKLYHFPSLSHPPLHLPLLDFFFLIQSFLFYTQSQTAEPHLGEKRSGGSLLRSLQGLQSDEGSRGWNFFRDDNDHKGGGLNGQMTLYVYVPHQTQRGNAQKYFYVP